MKLRERFFEILTFLVCLALPAWAGALALSEAELRSSLNQPLEARIGLLALTDGELSSLNVKISSADKGIANQPFQQLKHELLEDEQGHYIRVTSVDAVREPILVFKVEINWSKGHLVREYSLLIDPR